ncbi:hypothetical protein DKX38_017795 [Salix brachista]|uniref:Pectinesterase inhibitor domain-containing protein n=1 Tax=Salix brachista TaxID=2182728 RepID=A0A5N5KW78_9ROSI|nr:hypothetical protein DKX38_017795 [Salix brachista]
MGEEFDEAKAKIEKLIRKGTKSICSWVCYSPSRLVFSNGNGTAHGRGLTVRRRGRWKWRTVVGYGAAVLLKIPFKALNLDVRRLIGFPMASASDHEYISDLLRRTTEKSLRNVLVACENAFGIVESSFGAAMQSFHRKEYDDMLKLEQVAPRAQASCETSFTAPPSPPNPLLERNREMRILITMAIVSGKEILKF